MGVAEQATGDCPMTLRAASAFRIRSVAQGEHTFLAEEAFAARDMKGASTRSPILNFVIAEPPQPLPPWVVAEHVDLSHGRHQTIVEVEV